MQEMVERCEIALVSFGQLALSKINSCSEHLSYKRQTGALEELDRSPENYCAAVIRGRSVDDFLLRELGRAKMQNADLKVILLFSGNEQELAIAPPAHVDKILPLETRREKLIRAIADAYMSSESGRKRLVAEELKVLGINAKVLVDLSVNQSEEFLRILENLISKNTPSNNNNRISSIDRKILARIILSKGKVSSVSLSKELQMPLTTVVRHKKRVEREYLEHVCSLQTAKFGYRRVHMFIKIGNGAIERIVEKLGESENVVKIHRVISNYGIDLHVEVLLENCDTSNFVQHAKTIEGVRDVFWMENVQQVKNNIAPFLNILQKEDGPADSSFAASSAVL